MGWNVWFIPEQGIISSRRDYDNDDSMILNPFTPDDDYSRIFMGDTMLKQRGYTAKRCSNQVHLHSYNNEQSYI